MLRHPLWGLRRRSAARPTLRRRDAPAGPPGRAPPDQRARLICAHAPCNPQVLDEAKALATALSTIGKFTVKAKVGEDKRIFGSVSEQDVIEAVAKQTNKTLEKRGMTLPEIKTLGTYEVLVKLHPQVTAKFQLIVAKL
jgi:large subunit ribosomal protein L9